MSASIHLALLYPERANHHACQITSWEIRSPWRSKQTGCRWRSGYTPTVHRRTILGRRGVTRRPLPPPVSHSFRYRPGDSGVAVDNGADFKFKFRACFPGIVSVLKDCVSGGDKIILLWASDVVCDGLSRYWCLYLRQIIDTSKYKLVTLFEGTTGFQ